MEENHRIGPPPVCGAVGILYVSAMSEIFLASEMPPHQVTSYITTPTARSSNISRNRKRVARRSLMQMGMDVARASDAYATRSSGSMESSIHIIPKGSSEWAI